MIEEHRKFDARWTLELASWGVMGISYSNRLKTAGVESKIADAHAKLQAEVMTLLITDTLATKEDLQNLENRLGNRIDRLEIRVTAVEDKLEILEQKLEIMTLKLEMIEEKFNDKLDAMDKKFDAKFVALEAKFVTFDAKFDTFEAKFATLESNLTKKMGAMMIAGIGILYTLMLLTHVLL